MSLDAASALKINRFPIEEACLEERVTQTFPGGGMEGTMVSQDFRNQQDFCKQLDGYGLTTANILYRRPDHPWLLQTYVWQDYDLCPAFPALNKFLNFWLETLEGPLHSVTVAHARLIRPTEIRAIDGEFRLH
jgi:uncharacterized protein Usg